MNNTQINLLKIINKISEYVNFTETEKEEFQSTVFNGLFLNIYSKTKEMVNKQTALKITNIYGDNPPTYENMKTTIQAYFKELEEIPEAQKVLETQIMELLKSLFKELSGKLSIEQKNELLEMV